MATPQVTLDGAASDFTVPGEATNLRCHNIMIYDICHDRQNRDQKKFYIHSSISPQKKANSYNLRLSTTLYLGGPPPGKRGIVFSLRNLNTLYIPFKRAIQTCNFQNPKREAKVNNL